MSSVEWIRATVEWGNKGKIFMGILWNQNVIVYKKLHGKNIELVNKCIEYYQFRCRTLRKWNDIETNNWAIDARNMWLCFCTIQENTATSGSGIHFTHKWIADSIYWCMAVTHIGVSQNVCIGYAHDRIALSTEMVRVPHATFETFWETKRSRVNPSTTARR